MMNRRLFKRCGRTKTESEPHIPKEEERREQGQKPNTLGVQTRYHRKRRGGRVKGQSGMRRGTEDTGVVFATYCGVERKEE
jgi:hypothetical protein